MDDLEQTAPPGVWGPISGKNFAFNTASEGYLFPHGCQDGSDGGLTQGGLRETSTRQGIYTSSNQDGSRATTMIDEFHTMQADPHLFGLEHVLSQGFPGGWQTPICNLGSLNSVFNSQRVQPAAILHQSDFNHTDQSGFSISSADVERNDSRASSSILDPYNVTVMLHNFRMGNISEVRFEDTPTNFDAGVSDHCGSVELVIEEPVSRPRWGRTNNSARASRTRHSEAEWERLRPYLYYLYVIEQCTAEQVAYTMHSMHGFTAATSTYQKRFSEWEEFCKNGENAKKYMNTDGRQHHERVARRRPARSFLNKRRGVPRANSTLTVASARRETGLQQVSLTHQGTWHHQERILHAIGALVTGIFGAGKKSWTTGSVGFLPPAGVADNAKIWENLSDRCSGIAELTKAERYDQVHFLLPHLLVGLDATTKSCDPNFLIHFWGICLSLLDARVNARISLPRLIFVRIFLRQLKTAFAALSKIHPLVDLVDSLSHVLAFSPHNLRMTLGMGYCRAIDVLRQLIEPNHPVIFKMISHCTKHWKNLLNVSRESLESYYEDILRSEEICDNPEMKIAILHDYTYGMSESKYISEVVRDQAVELWTLTAGQCRDRSASKSLHYTSSTRSFAFATELLATYHLETWRGPGGSCIKVHDRYQSVWYMDQAIEILRHGDLECRIKAIRFSKRLMVWFKCFHLHEKVKIEKERSREILPRISPKNISSLAVSHVVGSQQEGSRRNRSRRRRRGIRNAFLSSLVSTC